MKSKFIIWIALMMAGMFAVGIAYTATQQNIRLSADETAVALAQETLIKIQNGENINIVEKTDASRSLYPFVMIYDNDRKLIASSAQLNGKAIEYPISVLDWVDKDGEHRISWAPQQGLRFASVGIKYDDGYIVAAVSLKEKERLVSTIGTVMLVLFIVYVVGSTIVLWIIDIVQKKWAERSYE